MKGRVTILKLVDEWSEFGNNLRGESAEEWTYRFFPRPFNEKMMGLPRGRGDPEYPIYVGL